MVIKSALGVILSLFLFALSATSAEAAIIEDWDCKEDETEQACVKNGRIKMIYIYDEIDRETAYSLARIDGFLPAGYKFPKIYINSFGGSVSAAKMMGRILRRRKASIETKDLIYPERAAECSSACVFVAAGATDRQLNHIGLHKPYIDEYVRRDKNKISDLTKNQVSDILSYFDEMGINPEIKRLTIKTLSTDIMNLTYNPKIPFNKQLIVKLGFHMHGDTSTRSGRSLQPNYDVYDRVGALEKAVSRGDAKAARKLGDIFFNGIDGFRKRIPVAMKWYQKASDLGDLNTTHYLGVIHDNGLENVPVDPAKSSKYYEKAAQAGLAPSQNNLGYKYFKGSGVPKNNVLAVYWLTRAAEQGEPFAYGSLGEIYFKGGAFPRNDLETFKWLKLAVLELPEGKSRNNDAKLLELVSKRLSKKQIELGNKLVGEWKPLRQSMSTMNEKEE